jgi:hypothetical protein
VAINLNPFSYRIANPRHTLNPRAGHYPVHHASLDSVVYRSVSIVIDQPDNSRNPMGLPGPAFER